jgi:putative CocE/NonD family hydrolase
MLRNASPRSALTCLLSLIAVLCPATFFSGRAASAESSEQKYQVFVERDITIPMRDGVDLIADAYRPAQDGKVVSGQFPVILIRTCYNKDTRLGIFLFDPEYFAKHGYIVVIEDVRGRYKSPGHFYHGIYEGKDGYDTIEWIAKQPWSNGKVGMTGQSYLAAVQQAAAAMGTPHLSSMFHIEAPLSYFNNGVRRGGAFVQMVVPVAFYFASTSKEAIADPVVKKGLVEADMLGPEWLKRWPFGKGRTVLGRVPEDERFFLDTWTHTNYDKFYTDVHLWEPNQYLSQYTDAAGFYFSGWYDQYRENEFYSALVSRKKGPIRLMMGPWGHATQDSVLGDVDFGPEAAISDQQGNELQLQWFDETLKGLKTALDTEPPVRIFVMGGGDGKKSANGKLQHGGRWRSESTWPLAGTQFTNYYFGPEDALTTKPPTVAESSSFYFYDPRDPVPTIGGASYFKIRSVTPATYYVPYGPQDQRESKECINCQTTLPLSARQDVQVFQTPPLDQDVEVTGPLTVKLWISSSAVDTDFTAKLIDVYPPSEDYPEGYAMNLADGIQRTHYRNGYTQPEMMKPGEAYEVTVELFATSNLFVKGHRIRVDISSSDYPAYDPNPNTGELYMSGHSGIVAKNVIYHDKDRPSHIILPIIPQNRR